MLSASQFALIQQSLPLVANAGVSVTEHFYARMFRLNPELKHIFNLSNQASGKQPLALFAAIARFATFLGEPEKLEGLKKQIAQKHVALSILPEHYPIVGTHLIATLNELFPNEFTKDIEAAWVAAYGIICDLLITEEAGLYHHNQAQLGGWVGARAFTIANIVEESRDVKSFYLAPCDGKPIMDFTAGQYLTVQVQPDGQAYRQMRHYSLTGKFGNQYRISVKRDGLVSGFLHERQVGDVVNVSAPAGDFTLKVNNKNKVFISAGVGITPMIAMLNTAVAKTSSACWFLHACQNPSTHSFKRDLALIADNNANVTFVTWYEEMTDGGHSGLMNINECATLPLENSDFYLCGPLGFMKSVYQQLIAIGVQPDSIHYELFGPHSDLSA